MSSSVRERVSATVDWSRTTQGRKMIRYSMVSVVAVIVSQTILAIAYGVLHWSARPANVAAVAISTVPAYYLNRAWTWGKRGRSRLMAEIVPFWSMSFLGLVLSTYAAGAADKFAQSQWSWRPAQTAMVMAASLSAFGVLWVAKFAVLNRFMFADGAGPTTRASRRAVTMAGAGDDEAGR